MGNGRSKSVPVASSHWLSDTTERTNRRQKQEERMTLKRVVCAVGRRGKGVEGREPRRARLTILRHMFGFHVSSVGIKAFTAVAMKSSVLWNITLCSPVEVNTRFDATYRFHLQGFRVSRAINQNVAGSKLLDIFFDLEDGGNMYFRNVC
jgi:hypothetical protein